MAGDGSLWVGSWRGLTLMPAADGRQWVGTAQGDRVLVDPAGGPPRWLAPPPAAPGERPGAVNALLQSPDGAVWVGRSTAIDLHDAADGRPPRALRHDRRQPDRLAGNEVTSLLVDRTGWIWIGGQGLGLQRHGPGGRHLWVRGADDAPDAPLANPDVRALLALGSGELLTAVSGLTGANDGARGSPRSAA